MFLYEKQEAKEKESTVVAVVRVYEKLITGRLE
jgi:hypothetical protein